MILLMAVNLTLKKEPEEGSLPEGWRCSEAHDEVEYYGDLEHHGELISKTTHTKRFGDLPVDLKEDGILADFKQLHQAGARGSIHLADSCGPKHICIALVDKGIFKSTGEVRWLHGPRKLDENLDWTDQVVDTKKDES